MPLAATLDAVLDCLYLSHVDPDALRRLPGLVSEWIGAETTGIWLIEPATCLPCGWFSINIADEMVMKYKQYFSLLDPWRVPFLSQSTNAPFFGHELVPRDSIEGSEYYNDFGRHIGSYHHMGAKIGLHAGTTSHSACFAAHRSEGGDEFTSASFDRYSALIPHIRRSLVLQAAQRGAEQAVARGTSAALLAAIPDPALVCDGHGRILHANAGVEAMDGMGALRIKSRLGQRTLVAETPAATRRLAQALASAAGCRAGGTIHLGDQAFAFVSPLPPGFADQFGMEAGLALVVLRAGPAAIAAVQSSLRAVFGLSEAEAEVACALAAGDAPATIAGRRAVRVSTVRTLLDRALVKTDAKDLRALVALVATMPHHPP